MVVSRLKLTPETAAGVVEKLGGPGLDKATAGIPLRRFAEPEEFGRAAAFLLSPAASYITGSMMTIDGGARASF